MYLRAMASTTSTPMRLIHAVSVENGRTGDPQRHAATACWGSTHTAGTCRCRCCAPSTSWWPAGAVVAGPKPTDTPSLADDQAEFTRLNDELFGDGTGVHSVGKGKVYAGEDAEAMR